MSSYLVLARKYRPAAFEEVVGQEHVAATLVSAIRTGRVAHAFLFAGTRGVGKTTMARILAKALNCLEADGPTAEPCNRCDACVAIARGDDIDVVEIDGASNRGIDEIRELRSNAIYRPNRCRYKVYYIDEVHMLTREAFNALLKTLEEPPEHVKFIFSTTDADRLPATVLSRCQRFDFRNIPSRMIAEHLGEVCKTEKVKVQQDAIFRIARAAAGSMRDGLSLLDQLLAAGGGKVTEDDVIQVLGTPADERTASVVTAIAEGDPAGALTELDGLLAGGITLESALRAVGEMFRHMMLAKICGPDSELVELPDSQRQRVAELAGKFDTPALVQALAVCQTTARGLHGLTSGRGLAEAAVVRLAAAEKFVSAASLLQRLEQLSAPSPGGSARAPVRPPARGSYEKKKPLAAPAARAAEPPPPPPPAPVLTDPHWDQEYLSGHWDDVVDVLSRSGNGQVSGLLRPARVVAVRGDELKLGFDDAHEPIRQRAERLSDQVCAAIGGLFGREVRCTYVPTGQPGEPLRPDDAAPVLSTAERAAISADPTVKAVLDFFDGSIRHIRREVPPEAESDEPHD